MIEHLLFICPICFSKNSIISDGKTECSSCHAKFKRKGSLIQINDQIRSCDEWFADIKEHLQKDNARSNGDDKVLFKSGPAKLYKAQNISSWQHQIGIYNNIDLPIFVQEGKLLITTDKISFASDKPCFEFDLADITCITTDSSHFLLKIKKQPYFRLDFQKESPYQLELTTRNILDDFWRNKTGRTIVEYQPKITFKQPKPGPTALKRISPTLHVEERKRDKLFYFFLKFVAKLLFKLAFRISIYGKSHLPKKGPFVIILNHEGLLDPFLVQAVLKRRISFFTKNSEFKNKLFRYVLNVFRAIPVKRHETDPQCIRSALRVLEYEEPVGIFIEGERTWDSHFLPPKLGVVKFLKSLDVPVYPVRIQGSFEVLPRWGSFFQLHPVKIIIGEKLEINKTEPIFETGKYIMDRLGGLETQ